IENLVANMAVENPQESQFCGYLYFETVAFCPIDTRLVNKEMLKEEENNLLNNCFKNIFHSVTLNSFQRLIKLMRF
ncbi:MAG: M24 family metallopeptidase C-terminal domain-containing protein, partial [Flavobacteriaceae bacterium]|nr:M24 family metallopeptidase C-terminal domain-containing protein [Flavobacteriaceae bacterium]